MIVALLNQKGGVGKTTLALHLAGQWAREGRRVTVIDADPQGSALDWSAQRAREGLPRLFGVIGLARDTLHHEAPELAQEVDHVVIDGPPRVAALLRSALLAADLVLIPAQPSPFDGWASAEMLRLLEEVRLFRPDLLARFVLNRCAARTVIARETRLALAGHEPAVLAARIGQRVAFADAARTGRLVCDLRPHGIAAREIAALTAEIGGLVFMTLLTSDSALLMPWRGPYDMILVDPPYGDTSLAWDRRVADWSAKARVTQKPYSQFLIGEGIAP